MNYTIDQVLQMGARAYFTLQLYLAHEAHCKSEYNKLLMKK